MAPSPKSLFEVRRSRLLELLGSWSYERRPVVLASGKKSDYYIDCRRTTLTSEGHFLVGSLFAGILNQDFPRVEAVGGMSLGADPLVSATSLMSWLGPRPLDAFYVRKEPKGHGTGRQVEAPATIGPGTPVALLEDVVTTGGSTIRAIEAARRDLGVEIACVLAIVDRQEEGGAEAISALAPFRALFTKEDFLSLPDRRSRRP